MTTQDGARQDGARQDDATEDDGTHLAADAGPDRVFAGRHPAELLTGARLRSRDEGGALAVGRLPGGAGLGHLGVVADIALSQAALVGTDAGQGQLTVGLDLRLLRAVPGPGMVEATATRVGASAAARLTQVTVRVDGVPVAVGSGRIVTAGAGHRPLTWSRNTEPWADVEAAGSIDTELGLSLRSRTDGRAELTATVSARLQNARPMLHGGAHLRLAELGMAAALGRDDATSISSVGVSDAGPAASRRLADLSLDYLRPVPADGTTVILVEAAVVRRGRRLAVVDARLCTRDGELLTLAHGTWLRPDDLG